MANQVTSKLIEGVLSGVYYQVQCPQSRWCDSPMADIRPNSKTYGEWFGLELSAENKKQLWMPEGMAHGFLATSERAEFLYKTTDYYRPEFERSLLWNDPAIGIEWLLYLLSTDALEVQKLHRPLRRHLRATMRLCKSRCFIA